jgi:hypothetical protein
MKSTAFKVVTNLEFANRLNNLCHTAFRYGIGLGISGGKNL